MVTVLDVDTELQLTTVPLPTQGRLFITNPRYRPKPWTGRTSMP
jgi:hypothetical protein